MLFEEVFGRSVQFIDLSAASKTVKAGTKKPVLARVKASEKLRMNGKNAKATGSKEPR